MKHWVHMIVLALGICASAAFAAPERIVSADGALTEIVYALGESERLVGVDTTSGYPAEAKEKPQIGYKRAISAEGTLSLAPEVLIATEDSGPKKILNQISEAGVKVLSYSAAPTLEAVEEKITKVAELLDKPEAGQALWQEVLASVKKAQAGIQNVERPARVLFILGLNDRSPLVGGEGSHADSIIQLSGAVNAAQGFEGYKPMSPEAIAATQADVVLMMTRNAHSRSAESVFELPGLSLTPAAKDQRLVQMDGMLMLGFGPRIGQAIEQLSAAFYPQQLAKQ